MLKTAPRILRLLTLLQARREWSGADLSERLEVDARTVRRDVDRLRELGYAIDSSSGPGGGYRLGSGNATPPLLLADDEAVAVAVALAAAAGTVANLEEVSLRVLVKLEQLLPSRLRRRLNALPAVTVALGGSRVRVDPLVLTAVAAACRDRAVLRFTYRDGRGRETVRTVEPMGVVHTGRIWYFAAWDLDREEWRTFRVDRVAVEPKPEPGVGFVARPLPEDLATFVSRSLAARPYRHTARLRLAGPAEAVVQHIPPWVGVVAPLDTESCVLTIGADTFEAVAALVIHAGVDFELLEPAEMAAPIRELAARLLRGVGDESIRPPAYGVGGTTNATVSAVPRVREATEVASRPRSASVTQKT